MFRGWTASGPRDTNIDFDLDSAPLQVHTNSAVGSRDILWVRFVELDSDYGPGITLEFNNPPEYIIGLCNPKLISFTMPCAEEFRIWTIRMQNNILQLSCNGLEIFDLNIAESSKDDCRKMWSLDFAHFKFGTTDSASDAYRQLNEGNRFSLNPILSIMELKIQDIFSTGSS